MIKTNINQIIKLISCQLTELKVKDINERGEEILWYETNMHGNINEIQDINDLYRLFFKAIITANRSWMNLLRNGRIDAMNRLLDNCNVEVVYNNVQNNKEYYWNKWDEYRKQGNRIEGLQLEIINFTNNSEYFYKNKGTLLRDLKNDYSMIDESGYNLKIKYKIQTDRLNKFLDAFRGRGVRMALGCEFMKNIGFDDFKPDVHMKRLFYRWGLLESDKDDEAKKCREAAFEIATKIDNESFLPWMVAVDDKEKKLVYLDNILWMFCASGYGDVCKKDPNCGNCKLRNNPCNYIKKI